jgi:hypothetical protein
MGNDYKSGEPEEATIAACFFVIDLRAACA